MRLAMQRLLDAEDDMAQAIDRVDNARLAVSKQADAENLFERDIETIRSTMEHSDTVQLDRPDENR